MVIKECPNCFNGSGFISLGNNKYKCPCCGETISENQEVQNRRTQNFTNSNQIGSISQNNGEDVYSKAINSVMEIECQMISGYALGSGYLISRDGYGITNAHVVVNEKYQTCKNIKVKIAGSIVTARVISLGDDRAGKGNGIDLALIKLDKVPINARPVTFANFNNVRTGEEVYVIGNSLGMGTCITKGIVSDKCRFVDGHYLMMTDCSVNSGNSGGPIFNSKGDVIGTIVSSILSAKGMNFAIKGDDTVNFINRYKD